MPRIVVEVVSESLQEAGFRVYGDIENWVGALGMRIPVAGVEAEVNGIESLGVDPKPGPR